MAKRKGVKKGRATAAQFAVQKQREKELWTMKVMKYMFQLTLDTAALTLADEFGFGPKRQKQFADAFSRIYGEIRALEKADTPDEEYSKAKVEQALQRACGENYVPRNERYKFDLITPEGLRISGSVSTL